MSSQLFEAQLLGPDNTASHQQLVTLITAGKYTGSGLPQVAHGYLDAFCDGSSSNGRRRWAGIALAAMMRASTGVVHRLKKLTKGLARIGAIILDPKENEEHRIVAGLIIRQGLELGIDFAEFWLSDKVLHSAPNFPRDASELWMGQFQTYLDTLSSLALANLNDEPVVLFPIALSTKDGFQWTGKSAVALLEKDVLTVVVSDTSLTKFDFVDLPVRRIKHIGLQQDSPHESQDGQSEYKMHEVVITLRPGSQSYLLNSSDHMADDLKVSFLRHEEAYELELGLQDARKTSRRSATVTTETATTTTSPRRTHRASAQDVEVPAQITIEESVSHDDSHSDVSLDEPTSSEQVQTLVLPAEHERSSGKLPRISLSTKQKVARTRQLPSGPIKVAKPRASKKAVPIIDASEDEDKDGFSQDEYALGSIAATRTSVANAIGKKSKSRRKAYPEDDDFDPKASKARPTTKRKRASSDVDEDSYSTKRRLQTKPSSSSRSGAVRTTAKKTNTQGQDDIRTASAPTRETMAQSSTRQNIQNGSRPSLIGALKKSNSPKKAIAPAFKKPGQPASTPRRPREAPVRTTPVEVHEDLDTLPVYAPSSTPRSKSMHEEDFGLGDTRVDAQILSSNTKRVPDSPHAESTAISGHANHDDVHRDKYISDLEAAKNDPFKHRRQGVQKMNSFTRKLTGESVMDDKGLSPHGEPLSLPAEMADGDFEIDECDTTLPSQPLPKHSPSLLKGRTKPQSLEGSSAFARIVGSLSTIQLRSVSTTSLQNAARDSPGVTHSTHSSQAHLGCGRQDPTTLERYEAVSLSAAGKSQPDNREAVSQQVQANDSVVSASREAIEDTLPNAPANPRDHADFDGEKTLVDEEMEMPEHHAIRASELRFRSSPPVPDSSSIRGDFTDESEPDPEPSPPTSRADELEWQAALQPHQRALHEQLLRTSKRVVRHIVDNETAVTDITDVFADDGERVLNLLVERQSIESAEAFEELNNKRQDLLKEFSTTSSGLKAQRKQIRSLD